MALFCLKNINFVDNQNIHTMLILETSWEVCNKMGGIYTVLSSRAREMMAQHQGEVVFVGPKLPTISKDFISQTPELLRGFAQYASEQGLEVLVGTWDVPGQPPVVLVDFLSLMGDKGTYYYEIWQHYQVESDKGYGDYDESALFSIRASQVMMLLEDFLGRERSVMIFNEWQTGMGLLYTKIHRSGAKTLFITHATTVGRSIAGNNKELYKYLSAYNGDQMARELGVWAKHQVEKAAAHASDLFATVSEITALECRQLLEREAAVLPNGFEPDLVPASGECYEASRRMAREQLLGVAAALRGRSYSDADTTLVAISGRYEYRNKGIDLFVDAIADLSGRLPGGKELVAYVLVPAWVAEPRSDLRYRLDQKEGWDKPLDWCNLTHWLHNFDHDRLLSHMRSLDLVDHPERSVQLIFVPCYLNGQDGIFDRSYYELLVGMDLTLFPSYYEPWGYTPLESIAFSIPTITTTLAGFGLWAEGQMRAEAALKPVVVLERDDDNYQEVREALTREILSHISASTADRAERCRAALSLSQDADWSHFYKYYTALYNTLY